jgi:ABC-type multidrug transport system fused ATPase/permease subunit
VHFPKFIFFLGLLTESLMFPCMQVSVGLMQKYLVNAVEYKNMHYMTYVYVLAAAILFMVIILNPLGEYLKDRAMWTFTKNLRELTIERLISYRFSFFETYQTGDLVLRLREDLDAIPNIYTNSIFRLLLGLFYGGGSVIVMLTFSWQLSLVVIALCLSESFAMAKMSEKITENSDILQKIMSKQNQMFFDIVKSLSFIKMASISRLIGERYNKYNEESAAKNIEINKVNIALNAFNDLFVAVNLLLVFSLGIIMYLANMIDLGSVMSFLYLQDGISYMIGNLRDFFSGISSQIVNYNRVSELLNQEVEEMDAESDMGKEPTELRCDDIIIRDLSFRYQTADKCTLNEVNLTIPKGKVTVIYGTSGGGKSTLAKLLLALYPPDSGSICIGETDYRQIGNARVRDYYAYVEQSTYLFYDTVEANIR